MAMTVNCTEEILRTARSALSELPGTKAFTFEGSKALLALQDTDDDEAFALDGRGEVTLTRFGKQTMRAAEVALSAVGLAVIDPAPGHLVLAAGGYAEIVPAR